RPVDLTAELVQAIIERLAEVLDRDFAIADLGDRNAARSPQDVADAPEAEDDGKQAHHGSHDDPAEPIGGGLVNTPEHVPSNVEREDSDRPMPVSQAAAS